MLILDYESGMHGSFLNYVINKYIFEIAMDVQLFDETGAAHNICDNAEYNAVSNLISGHFNVLGKYPPSTTKIITIKYNPVYKFIAMVNYYYRVPMDQAALSEDILTQHPMIGTQVKLRNQLYSKLSEVRDQPHYKGTECIFDYGAFFNFSDFLTELQKVASFLNLQLVYSPQLHALYQKFIKLNQGYQFWTEVERLLDCIARRDSCKIKNNVFVHAYLNYKLTKMFNIYDGPMFSNEKYCTNTSEIYKLL